MSKKTKIIIGILSVVLIVLLILLICILSGRFVIIKGKSMYPTYKNGQVLHIDVKYDKIDAGDVVVFKLPDNDEKLIKRVVAVEGDSVVCRETKLYVNGKEIVPVYFDESLESYPVYNFEVIVSKDCIFCLSDNYLVGIDSRQFGEVPIDCIIGKVG